MSSQIKNSTVLCFLRLHSNLVLCNKGFLEWIGNFRLFGKKCNGCKRVIYPEDWIRKAPVDIVYHLSCFYCIVCKRQLSTGEKFAMYHGSVYCIAHYDELLADPLDNSESGIKYHLTQLRYKALVVDISPVSFINNVADVCKLWALSMSTRLLFFKNVLMELPHPTQPQMFPQLQISTIQTTCTLKKLLLHIKINVLKKYNYILLYSSTDYTVYYTVYIIIIYIQLYIRRFCHLPLGGRNCMFLHCS